MIRGISLAAAVAGLALAAAPTASAPARGTAPVQRDWSRTIVATPEGGFRMGNPAAHVKLVEYGSLTCGHCAQFAQAGMPALVANHVRTGKVSYEFRNFILNGTDVMASLLARCMPSASFFRFVDRLYATQPTWIGKVNSLPQSEKERLEALPEGQRLAALARATGLTAVAAQFGLPAAKARACLANQAGLDRLNRIAEAAEGQGVQGTPTFFFNGANIGPQTWATLEPMIRESGG
ncbi:MAG TPA: thioredoxin domain-containing protein [Allosphingosinicella sp.]